MATLLYLILLSITVIAVIELIKLKYILTTQQK